jgi:hypothetical protein
VSPNLLCTVPISLRELGLNLALADQLASKAATLRKRRADPIDSFGLVVLMHTEGQRIL